MVKKQPQLVGKICTPICVLASVSQLQEVCLRIHHKNILQNHGKVHFWQAFLFDFKHMSL